MSKIEVHIKLLFLALAFALNFYSQNEGPTLSVKNSERFTQISRKQLLLNQLNKKSDNDTTKILTTIHLARVLNSEGDSDSASLLLEKSLELSHRLKNYWGIIHSNYDLGLILLDQGEYNKALRVFLQAQKLVHFKGDSLGIAHVQLLIGNLKIRTNDTKGALISFEQSLQTYSRVNNRKGISQAYYKIATTYNIINDYEKALVYFNKAIDLFKEDQDSVFLANCFGDLAIIYDEKKDFKKAEEHYLSAISILESNRDAHTLTRVYHNLAYSYFIQEKYDKALTASNKCSILARQSKLKEIIMANEALLSSLYEKKQNYKAAFEHFKVAELYSDSLDTNELSQEIERIEGLAKLEKEKARLKAEQEKRDIISQKEIKIQRIITTVTISGAVLMLVLLVTIVIGYKRRMRVDKLMAEIANHKASIHGQEMERERIAKELHDGIGGSLAALKLNLSNYISKHPSLELTDMKNMIGEVGKEVRTISHNLTPAAIGESSISDLFAGLVNKYNALKQIEVKYECLHSPDLSNLKEGIKRELYRVVQELFHNAFKYSNAKEIRLDVFTEHKILFLQIEDNGVGFERETKTEGIGLKNATNRIKILRGEISIDSKTGRGTAISIQIPITD